MGEDWEQVETSFTPFFQRLMVRPKILAASIGQLASLVSLIDCMQLRHSHQERVSPSQTSEGP